MLTHADATATRDLEQMIDQKPAIPVLDAETLRQRCLDAGADDVGFVAIERPELDDQRDDILSVFPSARTLISLVCRMNREPIRSPARSIANLEFHHAGDVVNECEPPRRR